MDSKSIYLSSARIENSGFLVMDLWHSGDMEPDDVILTDCHLIAQQ